MTEYLESSESDEVSRIPSIRGGGSYEDPLNPGTFLPGFTTKLTINDVEITKVVIDRITYNLNSTASTCTFTLPRRFDDFGAISYADAVKVWINEKYRFNGTIRNIVPSLGKGETVVVTVADDRVKLDGVPFEKNDLKKIIYNDRNPESFRTDQVSHYVTRTDYYTAENIMTDIMANITGIATEREGTVPDDLDVGMLEFTDVTCGKAIDMIMERVGDYKWFLTPDNVIKIFKQSEDDESRNRIVWVGEFGQDASNYNVASVRLNKSYSNVVNKVVFMGGRMEYQRITLLEGTWATSLEATWNLDNKDDEEYKDVYRKFTIMGSTGEGLMSTLISHPDHNAIVYWKEEGEFTIVRGFSVDYENETVTFQSPQTRVTDLETGEVEALPLQIIYGFYGDPLEVEASEVGPYEIVKTIRDENYIVQSAETHLAIVRLIGDWTPFSRDDTEKAQLRANEELERLYQPVISGTIGIVGDETWEIWKRVSLEGCTGDYAATYAELKAYITGITHNLSSGFTTTLNITTEKPLFGLGRLDVGADYETARLRDRVMKAEEKLQRQEGKADSFRDHSHSKAGSEGGISYSIYKSSD